ncbi:MAG: hypothetical protein OEX12_01045 [Gammaproteobacteria bacterium]|nr:hypothetical protein [Gammaproteobacteria bacterium]
MSHPLDQWEEDQEASRKEFLKQAMIDSSLVYQVFGTEPGKILLARWKDILMWSPTASRGEDQVSIGINEGYKSFIRTILKAIKIQEDQQL